MDFFELLKQDAAAFKGIDLVEKIKEKQKIVNEYFQVNKVENETIADPSTLINNLKISSNQEVAKRIEDF